MGIFIIDLWARGISTCSEFYQNQQLAYWGQVGQIVELTLWRMSILYTKWLSLNFYLKLLKVFRCSIYQYNLGSASKLISLPLSLEYLLVI